MKYIPQQLTYENTKTERDNIGINTNHDTFSQTPITPYSNQMTTQAEPLNFSTKTTNTAYFNQMITQTEPLNFSIQTKIHPILTR